MSSSFLIEAHQKWKYYTIQLPFRKGKATQDKIVTTELYLYYLVLESDFLVMLLLAQLARMMVAALICTTEKVLKDIKICKLKTPKHLNRHQSPCPDLLRDS